jgi:hypothetical protein
MGKLEGECFDGNKHLGREYALGNQGVMRVYDDPLIDNVA